MSEFGERSGLGSNWAINQLLSGRRPITLEIAYKVAIAMDVPISEVIDEESVKLIVACFAALDTKALIKLNMRLSVPLYSPVQALNFAKGRKAECTGNILTEYSPKRNLIALEILNEEMSPLLKQHDIVIVELGVNPEPKDIVLAKVPGLEKALLREYVILRFDAMGKEVFELRTAFPDFPKYTSKMEGVEILGVVIEKRTMRLSDN